MRSHVDGSLRMRSSSSPVWALCYGPEMMHGSEVARSYRKMVGTADMMMGGSKIMHDSEVVRVREVSDTATEIPC